MGQADFTIAGTPFSQRGYDATSGQVIALQLAEQPPKVNACNFSVFTFSDGAPAATVANGGVASPPSAGVNITMPTVGSDEAHSYMVQCSVTLPDGTTIVARRIIAIRNSLGFRKMCPTETVEYDPTFAWTEVVNDTVDLASTYAPLQAVNVDIGTEPNNLTIDIGNGADTITLDANDLTLSAANILALAAPAVRLGGAAASDRLTVSGAFSIITADVPDGTIFNVRSDVFGIYEAAQGVPSFVFACDADAASSLTFGSGTTVTIGQTQSLSGAGRTLTIRGQQGVAGTLGGDLILAGGLGGTPGTNLAGNVTIRLGTPVANATAKLLIEREDGTDIASLSEISASTTALYFGTPGGSFTGIVRGAALGLESSVLHVSIQPATDMYMGHGSNRDVFHRESGAIVLTEHLDADGATYFRFADGPTEVAIEQAQRATAGVGRPMRIQAQRGNGGKGGDLTLASGAPGTATTHEGGDIILQLHDPVASSSGRLSIMGNATEWLGIERNPASGGILMQCLSYSLSVYSASTMRLQSSGQTQVVGTSVVKGITGGNSTFEELQDANGRVFKRVYIGTAGPITSATNTYALTVATTTDRVYYCRAFVVATNDTDNEGACYEMRGAFKNVAGVLSAVGGAPSTIATHEDTNQTGLGPLLQISGTDLRLGLTTDSTDTVHFNAVLEVYERVLA
jgi:hypothetical protein